jgi:hypothetical protein
MAHDLTVNVAHSTSCASAAGFSCSASAHFKILGLHRRSRRTVSFRPDGGVDCKKFFRYGDAVRSKYRSGGKMINGELKHAFRIGLGMSAVLALLLTGGVPAFAEGALDGAEDSSQLDFSDIDEELMGTVFVMHDEVFSSDLEPIATLDEYIEVFEEAGIDVDSELPASDNSEPPMDDPIALSVKGEFGLAETGKFVAQTASLPMAKVDAPGCIGHDANRSYLAFSRSAKGGAKRGIGELRCGNDAWGWRHIMARHKGDYGRIGAKRGWSWELFATWCISGTLGAPKTAIYQAENKTWLYKAPVQVWHGGKLQATYQNRVSMRAKDFLIITAYIART